jgi:Xaa-Pro aminopeptidase
MEKGGLAIFHSNDIMPTSADGTMPFKQASDILYLTGIDQEETMLLLFPDAVDPKDREILFVRETNEHIAIWEGAKFTPEGSLGAERHRHRAVDQQPTRPRSSA